MRKNTLFIAAVFIALAFSAVGSLGADDAFPLEVVKNMVVEGNINPGGKTVLFVEFNESNG